jgi:hypothetical protein
MSLKLELCSFNFLLCLLRPDSLKFDSIYIKGNFYLMSIAALCSDSHLL